MNSRRAISGLERPRPTSRSTSCLRPGQDADPLGAGPAAGAQGAAQGVGRVGLPRRAQPFQGVAGGAGLGHGHLGVGGGQDPAQLQADLGQLVRQVEAAEQLEGPLQGPPGLVGPRPRGGQPARGQGGKGDPRGDQGLQGGRGPEPLLAVDLGLAVVLERPLQQPGRHRRLGRGQRDPEVAEGTELQVDVAAGPGQLQHPPHQGVGPVRVRLQEPPQQQPALERVRVGGLAGHPLGSGQPAPGDGVVVEVGGPGDAEEDRRPGRPGGVPGPPEPGVGPLGGGHGVPGLAQPPHGHPQPIQRLGGLGPGQGGLERLPRVLPAPGGERRPPGRQVVLPGHGASMPTGPAPESGNCPMLGPPVRRRLAPRGRPAQGGRR